jgi:pimeloyl-ACP methyl ester carboxylesterase
MEDLAEDLYKLLKELNILKCTLIGHSIGGKIAAVFSKNNLDSIDAIIFNSGSSIPILADVLEDFSIIEIASSRGMEAVANCERQINYRKEKAFQNEKDWDRYKAIITKTTVDGFISSRKALRTMPNDINNFFKN